MNSEVIIFAGPHGAGKDTLERLFTERQSGAVRHVRYFTREKAADEVDGQDYHFIRLEEFAEMSARSDFIEEANYPEGSSGTALPDLLKQLEAFRYVCITLSFEDGLSLAEKLKVRGITSRLLFIAPCSEKTMLEEPEVYIKVLSERMQSRGRNTDDIAVRTAKARLYREKYMADHESLAYIDNSNGRQLSALAQINYELGIKGA